MPAVRITPSLFAADPLELGRALRLIEGRGVDGIHFDVMDGQFVPEFGLSGSQLRAVAGRTSLPVDVHLMVIDPVRVASGFGFPGVRSISVHLEHRDAAGALAAVASLGKRPMVAVGPETDLGRLEPFLSSIRGVLVMSSSPGVLGAGYRAATPARIRELRRLPGAQRLEVFVDGGLDWEAVDDCARAGADVFVLGRSFFPPRAGDGGQRLIESPAV